MAASSLYAHCSTVVSSPAGMTPRVNPSAATASMRVEILHPAWTLTVIATVSMSMMDAISDMSTYTSGL